MGSASDWPTMQQAVEMLDRFGVPSEHCVVSAHRTPERLREYASGAADRGLEVIIAGAGRGPPARDGRGLDDPPRPGRAGEEPCPERDGLPALDRADAQGRARRHPGHRGRRGRERGPARRAHPLHARCVPRAALETFAKEQGEAALAAELP